MTSLSIKFLSALGSVVLTTGLVGLADPAVASAPTVRTLRVPFDQAELLTAAGRAAVRQRIQDASATVCPDDASSADAVAQCRREAIVGADRALTARLLASR